MGLADAGVDMRDDQLRIYAKDAIALTDGLTAAEVGAFFLLLMEKHLHGSLPTDDVVLARLAALRLREWQAVKPQVMRLFDQPSSGGLTAAERITGAGAIIRPAIPLEVRAAVRARDGDACVYCDDTEGPFHLDHRLPWSRGGKHTFENLCVACWRCNLRKGDLTAGEFMGESE